METTATGGSASGRPHRHYSGVGIETADRGELLLTLYRGAIRFLRRGIAALRAGDSPTASESLRRAQDIVEELRSSLNVEAGGVSVVLSRIYEYTYRQIARASCQQDPAEAEKALDILKRLLSASERAARSARTGNTSRPSRAGEAL